MSDSSAAEKQPEKSRSPVERIIVWGLILIGGGIAIYEARAKLGYNNSLSSIKTKMEEHENGGGEDTDLKLSDVKATLVSGGPSYSELKPDITNTQLISLTWPSLFKEYQIVLRLDSDQEDAIVLSYETPNAEPEPEPKVVESDESDPGMMQGGPAMSPPGMGPGGPGGREPGAGGSGRPQRPGGDENPTDAGETPAEGDSADAKTTPPEEPGTEADPPKEDPEADKKAEESSEKKEESPETTE